LPTFSIYDAFDAVDSRGDGKITKDELRSMVERNGFNVTDKEI
jgi:Ca2+-binding EF-hand superfamily protein